MKEKNEGLGVYRLLAKKKYKVSDHRFYLRVWRRMEGRTLKEKKKMNK